MPRTILLKKDIMYLPFLVSLLAFGVTLATPALNIIDAPQPLHSCNLIFARGELHCAEDLGNDLGTGPVVPDDDHQQQSADFRDCLLRGESKCELPTYKLTPEDLSLGSWEGFDGLLEDFTSTHPDYSELKVFFDELRRGGGEEKPSDGGGVASSAGLGIMSPNDSDCCLRSCAFAGWFGWLGYVACLGCKSRLELLVMSRFDGCVSASVGRVALRQPYIPLAICF